MKDNGCRRVASLGITFQSISLLDMNRRTNVSHYMYVMPRLDNCTPSVLIASPKQWTSSPVQYLRALWNRDG